MRLMPNTPLGILSEGMATASHVAELLGPSGNPNLGERTVFTIHSEIAKGGCLTARDGRPHQHARQTARYARQVQKGAGV